MEEVREMRRKVSEEFGHDLNRLAAYYQKLKDEMRKSGKYTFAALPNEEPESEENAFGSLISVQLAPEEFEIVETLAKARRISLGNLIREWIVERIEAR